MLLFSPNATEMAIVMSVGTLERHNSDKVGAWFPTPAHACSFKNVFLRGIRGRLYRHQDFIGGGETLSEDTKVLWGCLFLGWGFTRSGTASAGAWPGAHRGPITVREVSFGNLKPKESRDPAMLHRCECVFV